MGQLLEAPVAVVALDELGDGGPHVGEISKDAAVDRLLLEGSIAALNDAVGFRLFKETEAELDAAVADLIEEMVRQMLAAVVHPERGPAGHVRRDGAERHDGWAQNWADQYSDQEAVSFFSSPAT